ncbi:unnamed protein product, partial [Ectocarpus sp. 12 AP-2014]
MSLAPGWTAYKAADGKEYFHNATTNQTTWDRPTAAPAIPKAAPPLPSKPSGGGFFGGGSKKSAGKPAGGGGATASPPPDLLASIRGGASLKKAETVDKSVARGAGTVTGGGDGGGGPASSYSAPAPAPTSGGGGGGMMGELANAMARRKSSGPGRGGPPAVPY